MSLNDSLILANMHRVAALGRSQVRNAELGACRLWQSKVILKLALKKKHFDHGSLSIRYTEKDFETEMNELFRAAVLANSTNDDLTTISSMVDNIRQGMNVINRVRALSKAQRKVLYDLLEIPISAAVTDTAIPTSDEESSDEESPQPVVVCNPFYEATDCSFDSDSDSVLSYAGPVVTDLTASPDPVRNVEPMLPAPPVVIDLTGDSQDSDATFPQHVPLSESPKKKLRVV